jgi:hypothetical protein
MRPKVHIETSVLSYLAARPSRNSITAARQRITEHWWNQERHRFDLLASELVTTEAERGDPSVVQARLSLLRQMELIPLDNQVLSLAQSLVTPSAIPVKAAPDAIHIAAANIADCDFLLTWNFRHIANAHIRREVERLLSVHGYRKTTICTPEELVSPNQA